MTDPLGTPEQPGLDSSSQDVAAATGAPLQLGPDWVPGPDGLLFRRGARVLLLDDEDRILLVRSHDVDEPDRSWWFTVGGGIDEGETAAQAALRELREETGIVLDLADLVGPVVRRTAVFSFLRNRVRQDEEFFLARVTGPAEVSRDGWTDVERAFVDDVRWWSLDDLGRSTDEVFPLGLVALVRALLPKWDGVVRELSEER